MFCWIEFLAIFEGRISHFTFNRQNNIFQIKPIFPHIISSFIYLIMIRKLPSINILAKNCVDLLLSYQPTHSLQLQCQNNKIISSLNDLKFQQFRLKSLYSQNGIGIRNILIYRQLRLTIYYLGQGQIMKIHDHPNMSVISYIFKGQMQANLYTNVVSNQYLKEQQILTERSISFIDGMRQKKHNLHEFIALKPTFFLDIIFPDYDYQSRTCRHYRQQSVNQKKIAILSQIEDLNIDFFQI